MSSRCVSMVLGVVLLSVGTASAQCSNSMRQQTQNTSNQRLTNQQQPLLRSGLALQQLGTPTQSSLLSQNSLQQQQNAALVAAVMQQRQQNAVALAQLQQQYAALIAAQQANGGTTSALQAQQQAAWLAALQQLQQNAGVNQLQARIRQTCCTQRRRNERHHAPFRDRRSAISG